MCVHNEAFLLYSKKLPISQACISNVSQDLTLLLDLLRKLACLFLLLFSDWLLQHYEKKVFWYKLKVVHLSCGDNCEKYYSLYKKLKKKRNNTSATLCWMHLSTMFLMHNMTSVSLVCLRSRSWERRIHGKFHVVVVRWRSKKPRNKNYATRAESFLIFCCF